MRGRKLYAWAWARAWEEIDNPRMRGRKLLSSILENTFISEEIDNPRMRGRKLL